MTPTVTSISDGISNRDEFRAGLEPDDRGVGAAPLKPKVLFPKSHDQVERNPLLDAGDFSDADGDAHIATQWQVYATVRKLPAGRGDQPLA